MWFQFKSDTFMFQSDIISPSHRAVWCLPAIFDRILKTVAPEVIILQSASVVNAVK